MEAEQQIVTEEPRLLRFQAAEEKDFPGLRNLSMWIYWVWSGAV